MGKRVIIFVKNARPGHVKTRLADSIGDDAALEAYRQLTVYTKSVIDEVDTVKEVWYSTELEREDIWSNGGYLKRVQEGPDLGTRICNAMEAAFSVSADERVIVIGSDCAELTTDLVNEAFEALREYDVVIGPATDGGYYLLGISSFQPSLFLDREWSTDHVYKDAVNEVGRLGLNLLTLPELSDVDTVEDWEKAKGKLAQF